MNLQSDWQKIRTHFSKSFWTNLHVSMASVDSNHKPTVTPIGSLFLDKTPSGFYFEKFPSKLPQHAKTNPNICILAVNSGKWMWLKALFKGKFEAYPALKLYGQLGERRAATEEEIKRLNRRMRRTKGWKGHEYLWGNMTEVREVSFTKVEKINLGAMTQEL